MMIQFERRHPNTPMFCRDHIGMSSKIILGRRATHIRVPVGFGWSADFGGACCRDRSEGCDGAPVGSVIGLSGFGGHAEVIRSGGEGYASRDGVGSGSPRKPADV